MEESINGNSTRQAVAAASPSETERILLQIWSEVLNIGDVGIHDDFLGLGGDSLAATRCINRVSTAFGVELGLDLFLLDSVSIAQIATEIAKMHLDASQIVAPENG